MKRLFITGMVVCLHLVSSAQQFKFSHRGGRGLMPENTVIAMENALDFDTALEMDLYLSRDNQVFVYHDGVISPVYATNPDGSYVTKEQANKKRIIEYTYPELRSFDIGTRPNPEFPRKKNVKAYIPLFAELVDSVERYAQKGGLEKPSYSVEIKVPSGKLPELYKQHLVDAAMKIIAEKNITDRVIIQSFDVEALEYLHKKYPGTKTAYLVFIGRDDFKANLQKLSFKPTGYSPYYKQVTREMIDYCHKNNIQVITWTVDDKSEIERLRQMGVDVVISDYPDYF
ncbi:glycerophosphodiester phosphodiesterase (plasmid) [Pedobacter sp. BS3]|uniref:glycerophosphodiester phosphodiesterase family protein n=1 Tax=Pedobacter sp. BS3 TaxID=2567937 RepID=UPI0011ED3935|nr:glycerophosphodiester phosphodiesterase family protein [Pedobacter sp. BS3]TZF85836.1 glycerophosphodiester phosphodiesterase [Pedobacter sp. BS3]